MIHKKCLISASAIAVALSLCCVLAAAARRKSPESAVPKAAKGELKPKIDCASLQDWKIPASSIGLPRAAPR